MRVQDDQPRAQIFLLSRDRPALFKEALDSILAQAREGVEVIVSDNSEYDAIERLMTATYPNVRYLRRRPALDIFAHHRTIIDEASAPFFVMFHDDDVMLDGYVEATVGALEQQPELVAVACNAMLIRDVAPTDQHFMGMVRRPRLVRDATDFLRPYLAYDYLQPPPFPGYMYRTTLVKGTYLEPSEGGKYADVSFLAKLLHHGPILWLPAPLMAYRLHTANASGNESVGQKLRLLRHLFANEHIDRHSSEVREFRFRFWFAWWRQFGTQAGDWRRRKVLRFLVRTAFRLAFTQPRVWVRAAAKLRYLVTRRVAALARV